MHARPISAGALVRAVRIARADPDAQFRVPGDWPMSAADVLNLWRRGVDARASRGLPATSARAARRLADLRHDLPIVEDYLHRRIRRTGCRNLLRDRWMQQRYPHIHNQPWYD
jgi:hypothetical protein